MFVFRRFIAIVEWNKEKEEREMSADKPGMPYLLTIDGSWNRSNATQRVEQIFEAISDLVL